MKFSLLLGGTAGFLCAFVSGVLAGNDLTIALRDAALGCLVGAGLMRFFHLALVSCVREMAVAKTTAEQKVPSKNFSQPIKK